MFDIRLYIVREAKMSGSLAVPAWRATVAQVRDHGGPFLGLVSLRVLALASEGLFHHCRAWVPVLLSTLSGVGAGTLYRFPAAVLVHKRRERWRTEI